MAKTHISLLFHLWPLCISLKIPQKMPIWDGFFYLDGYRRLTAWPGQSENNLLTLTLSASTELTSILISQREHGHQYLTFFWLRQLIQGGNNCLGGECAAEQAVAYTRCAELIFLLSLPAFELLNTSRIDDLCYISWSFNSHMGLFINWWVHWRWIRWYASAIILVFAIRAQ